MGNDVLVVAKLEFVKQLQEILTGNIFEGMTSVWEDVKSSEQKQLLKKFQEKLCSVPKWNQDIINGEYNKIVKKVSKAYLDKLLEAVFISSVKILSIVKLNSKSPKTINVNVPETKHFIHMCFVETARCLYREPHLVEDREKFISSVDAHKNIKKMSKLIGESIEKTIRHMIPMEDILEKYLNPEDPEEPEEPDDIPEPTVSVSSKSEESEEEKEKEEPTPVDDTGVDTLFMEESSSGPQYGFPSGTGTEQNNGFLKEQSHPTEDENLKIKIEKESFFTESDSD
jgi:hypothetical protein